MLLWGFGRSIRTGGTIEPKPHHRRLRLPNLFHCAQSLKDVKNNCYLGRLSRQGRLIGIHIVYLYTHIHVKENLADKGNPS